MVIIMIFKPLILFLVCAFVVQYARSRNISRVNTSERWGLGVCGGIARHLGVDVMVVRVVTVLAVLLVPVPVVCIYVALGQSLTQSQY